MARTDEIRARLETAPQLTTRYGPSPGGKRYQLATATDNAALIVYGKALADLVEHASEDLAYLLDEVAQLRAELATLDPLRLAAADLRDAQTWIERAAAGEAEEDAACGAFDDAAEAICAAVDALRAAQ
jgi:hypothetical protein